MKKNGIYILSAVIFILLAALIITKSRSNKKEFDKRVTLDEKYKSPYGAFLAYTLMPKMFPGSTIEINKESPTVWYDSVNSKRTLFFLLSRHFNPDEDEMDYLRAFVKEGNDVFLCTPQMDYDALEFFNLKINYNFENYGNSAEEFPDSVYVSLVPPLYSKNNVYFNPGYTYTTYFSRVDTTKYYILGKNENNDPNFVKVNYGKGSFYLHSNPFLFDNYFLLTGNNKDYFEKVMSAVPAGDKRIVWDEYYRYKLSANDKRKEPSPFRVLFSYDSFRKAFILAILLLLLFVLLNIKRVQRIIPIIPKLKNESLDFVKTIGRLYYEKQDHVNLANKMVVYFLEHIRSKYFLSTSTIDDEFVRKLSVKSGYDENETRKLIDTVHAIQVSTSINQKQLADYYNQFQKFYKHTN
ncbi:DUF4350 domain-containing protein [Chitinophagaceae bacterium LWZ2-11]